MRARPWLLPAGLFALASLLYHLPALGGRIPTEDDLEIFYFPLLAATGEALRRLDLPLWTPLIFGGYPLFADGEAGMLYPIHLLLLPWFTPEAALVVLWLLHSWLASIFTYALLRTLGVGMFGAMVGGLIYAYSGFAAGQIIHLNVLRSMVWLPLELLLAERMCQAGGVARFRWAVLTGAVFGIQALALHVHITLLSALAVGAFVVYRALAFAPLPLGEAGRRPEGPRTGEGWRPLLASLSRAVLSLAVIGAVGVGLAAVQLIPLWELAAESYRSRGLPEHLAATNSLWPGSLATLLLPRLFDVGARDFWGPWVKWETVIYVGLLPLALAGVGLISGRGRHRAFFAGLAGASLLLAMGPAGPIPLWDWLHSLPGFNVLRSPGRFSLLFSLAIAVAAGYGADWLLAWRVSPLTPTLSPVRGGEGSKEFPSPLRGEAGPRSGPGEGRPFRSALLVILFGTAGVLLAGLALGVVSDRLRSYAVTGSWLVERYLEVPGVPGVVDGQPLTMYRAAALAAEAISPGNPATAWQLALALAAALILGLTLAPGPLRAAALAAIPGVVFLDLWVMGLSFHPYISIEDLQPKAPQVVLEKSAALYRVFTVPTPRETARRADANRLMLAGVHDAAGYSSIQPDRHASYVSSLMQGDDDLLDLWSVRYVVRPRWPKFPDYERVSFDPERPIFRGKLEGAGKSLDLLPDGGPVRADEVRVVSKLRDSALLREGEEVARLTLVATDGAIRTLPLRAGVEVSEGRLDPAQASLKPHGLAEVAFDYEWVSPSGRTYTERLFYARFPLERPMTIQRVSIEQTAEAGRLLVYGVGLLDRASGWVTQVWDRGDHRVVYEDHQIVVEENMDAFPRAFLAPAAVVAPPGTDVLGWMHEGPFDPQRVVIVEEPLSQRAQTTVRPDPVEGPWFDRLTTNGISAPLPTEEAGPAGRATIQRYSEEEVVVETQTLSPALLVLTDSYFEGWKASVDGQPAAILRADYLFRAVPVPAGSHTVVFTYAPGSVAVGLFISLAVAGLVVAMAVAALKGARLPVARGTADVVP